MHAGELDEVNNFTIVGSTAKHCVDQYTVLFHYCSLEGDTAMPGGLHARLCHAFLVLSASGAVLGERGRSVGEDHDLSQKSAQVPFANEFLASWVKKL